MFTKEDVKQIEQRGSSVQTVEEQVERFKKGFPWYIYNKKFKNNHR